MFNWLFGKCKQELILEAYKQMCSNYFREEYEKMEDPNYQPCLYCQQVMKTLLTNNLTWAQCPCGKEFKC